MSDTAVKNRAALEMEREVANRIMALRVDSGYTQAEMADMTGFSLELVHSQMRVCLRC